MQLEPHKTVQCNGCPCACRQRSARIAHGPPALSEGGGPIYWIASCSYSGSLVAILEVAQVCQAANVCDRLQCRSANWCLTHFGQPLRLAKSSERLSETMARQAIAFQVGITLWVPSSVDCLVSCSILCWSKAGKTLGMHWQSDPVGLCTTTKDCLWQAQYMLQLSRLVLHLHKHRSSGCFDVCSCLQKGLKQLAFQNVGCSIKACQAVSRLTQHLSSLKGLRLYNNMSDDEGAQAIAQASEVCSVTG